MRILLIIFCLFSQIMAYRFLFAADVECEDDNVFQYTVSYWDGDNNQLSKNRTVTAFKKLFFYQEGASQEFNYSYVYAEIYHNCTKSGEMDSFEFPLEGVRKDNVVQRIDYYINLSRLEELPKDSSSTNN